MSLPAEQITYLRSLPAIRTKAQELYQVAVESDGLPHFSIDLTRLPHILTLVEETMAENYPGGIPSVPFHSRWRHFEFGNSARVAEQLLPNIVFDSSSSTDMEKSKEVTRCLLDLALVSVLLDAGAGPDWKYIEPGTSDVYTRSEGLGIASFHMFCSGAFSNSPRTQPCRVDAQALVNLSDDAIVEAFQVHPSTNPLVGLAGRTALLKRLGTCMLEQPTYFQTESTWRPGNLVDYLCLHVSDEKDLDIAPLWNGVLIGLASMWPTDGGRTIVKTEEAQDQKMTNLGDVWTHSCLSPSSPLIPFHKLSQWITYSVVEPLEEHLGWTITGLDQMTGLPEYRNGGLFLDEHVLVLKDPSEILNRQFHPSDELIVEWRALTIVLLDQVYAMWKTKYNVTDASAFPMVKLLEAGTWKAGRKVAKTLRPNGTPPIQIQSDGTVF